MGIVFIIFGPALLAWPVLAALPKGLPFLIGFGLIAGGLALLAFSPVRPSNGPDDWFRGIEQAGGMIGLIACFAVLPAQGLRWWYDLSWPRYGMALILFAFLVGALGAQFGDF